MVRAGVQVRAVVRVVRPLDRTNYSIQRAIPSTIRAAVLCVRWSRRPWSQNTSKLSSDFGLSLFKAGLKG